MAIMADKSRGNFCYWFNYLSKSIDESISTPTAVAFYGILSSAVKFDERKNIMTSLQVIDDGVVTQGTVEGVGDYQPEYKHAVANRTFDGTYEMYLSKHKLTDFYIVFDEPLPFSIGGKIHGAWIGPETVGAEGLTPGDRVFVHPIVVGSEVCANAVGKGPLRLHRNMTVTSAKSNRHKRSWMWVR